MKAPLFVQLQISRYRERYVQTAIVVALLIIVMLVDLACIRATSVTANASYSDQTACAHRRPPKLGAVC